ncbi:MAG: rhodanese-like domain-containing protein [Gammaproteobacteria bacterium]|nr:rhodanese-like domain-containing protein [Gammaproteobacteria bacterium]
MENILPFIIHHWLMVGILIVLLVALLYIETQGKVKGMSRVNPEKATQLINRENAVVIDIRDSSAFGKGHIAQAINIPASEIGTKDLTKYREKPLILVCNTGTTVMTLGHKLKQQGLTNLYFLQGGITAWQTAHLPLVKK